MYRRAFGNEDSLGRDRFASLLDRYGLKVRARKRKPRTTDSTHGLTTYPNMVKDLIPTRPDELWVSDITYIDMYNREGHSFCYLSMILDAYTEEIVGFSVGPTLQTVYCKEALEMALKRLEGKDLGKARLFHHSDRGIQYASSEYVRLLKEHDITISMTESGDPKDNAMAERINNTMKNELLRGRVFRNIRDVQRAVTEAVRFYNCERPHMSIDMKTPLEASLCTGEIPKRWKSRREEHIKSRSFSDISEKSLPLPPDNQIDTPGRQDNLLQR